MPVRRARRTDRISIASVSDFRCGPAKCIGRAGVAFPYCFDVLRARAIYVRGVGAEGAQNAPFYYLHLRQKARSLVSVPFERIPLTAPQISMPPVFVFSPGRCGSTLLSRILSEAGVPGVSEPDFTTQAAALFRASPSRSLRAYWRTAMWAMMGDLVAALDTDKVPVIKLRAETCAAPALFLHPHAGKARAILMMRGFEDWARSTARAFGADPRKAVRKYVRAMRCYPRLQEVGDCLTLHYEDLVQDPAGVAVRLGRFLGQPVDEEDVLRGKRQDAQSGTPLAATTRRPHPGWEAKFDAAMNLWHSPRLVGVRDQLDSINLSI